jgi:glycosyltransferase involved in cell wall biosynthesis
LKVLLSAYSCCPGAGSERGIGWNWALCIAARGDQVYVITRSVNAVHIAKHLARHPIGQIEFIYHDLAPLFERLYRLPLGNYFYYLLWQHSAASVAEKLHGRVKFDRVQHITWGSFRAPTFMGRLGIPLVFGPVGGGEDTPGLLRRGLGWRGRGEDALRRISRKLTAPLMAATYRSACEILATTEATRLSIAEEYRGKVKVHQAAGVEMELLAARSPGEPRRRAQNHSPRLKLLYVGRLLPWKGVHLALKALVRIREEVAGAHLTIVGSGRDLPRLKRLCRRLSLNDSVSFMPWVPRDELPGVYSRHDLFLFPSLHDSGGMAVLEAMAFGLPVVCLDLGGPAMAVDAGCGRVIGTAARSEDQVVEAIAESICEIHCDRRILHGLSRSARARAAERSWPSIVSSVYAASPVELTS